MAPWPRSVDKAEEAGMLLTESEIYVRLSRETMLVVEGYNAGKGNLFFFPHFFAKVVSVWKVFSG